MDLPTPTNTVEAIETGHWIFDRACQDGSPEIAARAFNQIFAFAQWGAVAMSIATYLIVQNWDEFGLGTDFYTWATQNTGKHIQTFENYYKTGKLLYECPERQEMLAEKNIGEVIPIANAYQQGYLEEEEHWKSLEMASNEAEVRQTIREIKEVEPRKYALVLTLDQDGTIWASKDGVLEVVGALSLSNRTEIVQQAIARITNKSGMLLK